MNLQYEQEFEVGFELVDYTLNLKLNGLCTFMQTVANKHASLLGLNYYQNADNSEEENSYYWILSKAKYVVDKYPKWEEMVQLRTFPRGRHRLAAMRGFDIINNGEKCGYIIGEYLLMDARRQRPVKIQGRTDALAVIDFPYEGEVIEKLKPEGQLQKTDIRKPYYTEIDLNNHMNNAFYINWATDMLDLEIHDKYEIAEFQINYNKGIQYGQSIKVSLYYNSLDEDMYVTGDSEEEGKNYFTVKMRLRHK